MFLLVTFENFIYSSKLTLYTEVQTLLDANMQIINLEL